MTELALGLPSTFATAAIPAASDAEPAAGRDYADLRRLVIEAGLLRAQNGYYVLKAAIAIGILGLAVGVALFSTSILVLVADAAFLGFAFTQIALLSHDVGHYQTCRGRRANALARYSLGNFGLGISQSWWVIKHNQHHATPNHIDEDPDLKLPFVLFSERQIASRPRLFRPMFAIQAFTFVLLLPFQGLSMRAASIIHIIQGKSPNPVVESLGIAVHFAAYGWLLVALGNWAPALALFAVHQGVFGLYNSSVFATNHKGMPIIDESERLGFLREQVLTSRNITGHSLTDFWYGGLNYQIEHHLFPTMPRNRLAKAQVLVRAFCQERGISYHETSAVASYREVFGQLHRAGASLRGSQTAEGAS